MHQDGAYFEFEKEGPVGTLNYACDCSTELDNGPLYVVPGSHKHGYTLLSWQLALSCSNLTAQHLVGHRYIAHKDTESHLGLPEDQFSFDNAVPVNGKAGDTLFFHVHTVHGSTPNRSQHPRATFINRYVDPSDRQTIHATSVALREAGEAGKADMPVKERSFMVRGRRAWTGEAWDLPVQHH